MTTTTLPTVSPADFLDIVGAPLEDFAHQCHSASLALVKRGPWPEARVARGTTAGVRGQHSWVVLGEPYDPHVTILDPTLWSYTASAPSVLVARAVARPHRPHGFGSIYGVGRPHGHGGDTMTLAVPVSSAAEDFLASLGPLDARGWANLANAPVGDWPAAEVIAAMYDTPGLRALVPIDRVGMLTDRNPQGLYLRGDSA